MRKKVAFALLMLLIGSVKMAHAIQLPFSPGETWYICNGYNGYGVHDGNPMLDLSTYSASPVNGGCDPSHGNGDSGGQIVTAPFSGKLSSLGRSDMACITTSDRTKSMKIGHFYLESNLKIGDTVSVNDPLGTVMEPNSFNNFLSHIHISGHEGAGCTGSIIPFDDAHGMRFEGDAPDMAWDKTISNQWGKTKDTPSGTKLSRILPATWHPAGTLVRGSDQKVFFLEKEIFSGKMLKRYIVSADVFNASGLDWNAVVSVSEKELACYRNGTEISGPLLTQGWGVYPEGTLFQQTGTNPVYVISEGTPRLLNMSEQEFLSLGYRPSMIKNVAGVWSLGDSLSAGDFKVCETGTLATITDTNVGGKVEDSSGGDSTSSGYFSGSVPPNPQAAGQYLVVPRNTASTITLTAGDPTQDPLTFSIASNPSHGTLSLIAAHNRISAYVTYTPDPNFSGQDSFTFKANDGLYDSLPAVVSLRVEDNPPPAYPQTVETSSNASVVITMVGGEVDPVTFSIATNPAHGTLSAVAVKNRYSAEVTYTPEPGYWGPDSFTFRAYDGRAYGSPATVSLTVTAVANLPFAYDQSVLATANTPIIIELTGYGPNWEPVTFSISTSPSHGTLGEVMPNNRYSAKVVYTPSPGFSGSDSFTFRTNDGVAFSAPAAVSITVR